MPNLFRSIITVAALGAVCGVIACDSSDEGESFYTGEFGYTEVHLTPSIVKPGMTTHAHLLAFTAEGTLLGEVATTWTGDQPSVAVVDPDGTIHAQTLGQVTLSTAADQFPIDWSLNVTPADTCGQVLDVADWLLAGNFAWHDTASAGDSSVSTHHTGSWSISAREPRQVNSTDIVWRFRLPRVGETLALEVNDTFRVGSTTYIQRSHVHGTEHRSLVGMVVLDLAACELHTLVYPPKADSFFKVRPGFADSLVDGWEAGGWQPFATPRVAVDGMNSSTPVALADTIPLLPSTSDTYFGVGYAPTGYAAYISLWRPLAAPVALSFTGTPAWEVPSATRRR